MVSHKESEGTDSNVSLISLETRRVLKIPSLAGHVHPSYVLIE